MKSCYLRGCANDLAKFSGGVAEECITHHIKQMQNEMTMIVDHFNAMKEALTEEKEARSKLQKKFDALQEKSIELSRSETAKRRPSIIVESISLVPNKKSRSEAPFVVPSDDSSQEGKFFKDKTKTKTNGKENSPKADRSASAAFLKSNIHEGVSKALSTSKLLKQPKLAFKSLTKAFEDPRSRSNQPPSDNDATFCEIAERKTPEKIVKTEPKALKQTAHKRNLAAVPIHRSKTDDSLFAFNMPSTSKAKLGQSKTTHITRDIDPDETPDLTVGIKLKEEKLTQRVAVNQCSIQDIFDSSSNDSVLCLGTQKNETINIANDTTPEEYIKALQNEFLNQTEYSDPPSPDRQTIKIVKAKSYYKECQDCRDFYKNCRLEVTNPKRKCPSNCTGYKLRMKDLEPPVPPSRSPLKRRGDDTPSGFWNLRSQLSDDPGDRTEDDL